MTGWTGSWSGSSRAWTALAVGSAAALALVYLTLGSAGDLRARPERFLVWAAIAVTAFVTGSVALTRASVTARAKLGAVVVGALVFRLALLPSVPSLSDDVWRYLWDGRVAAAGIDPFLHPPDAPQLEAWMREDGVDAAILVAL